MFFLNDTKQADHAERQAFEQYQQQVKAWVSQNLALSASVEEYDISTANAERQLGRTMWASELEARLKKLSPGLLFEVNPTNPSMKAIYKIRDGKKVFVCAYHNGVMPEYSIMRVRTTMERDYNTWSVDRKDFPKAEAVPSGIYKKVNAAGDLETVPAWKFPEDTVLPGWRKIQIPWGEAMRGWRTVLVRLVMDGLVSPEQVERVFSPSDRASWAGLLGKRTIRDQRAFRGR